MKIPQEHKDRIENMMEDIECPNRFECYNSKFDSLRNVRITAGGTFIECLDETMNICKFAMSFGKGRFCYCPIRNFIAKNCRI